MREKEDNKKKVIVGLKIAGFLLCYAILVVGIIVVTNSNYYDFFYDELGIELEGILPVIFIGAIGLIGSLTTFAFGWWEELPGIARVICGFILGIFINVIMLVMSIVALIVLIVRGYDYY